VYSKIASATNYILQIDNLNAVPVGGKWPARWIRAHTQFKVVKEKPIEQVREEGMNVYNIQRWFQQLKDTIKKHEITAERFYNVDEMGICIGMVCGQWVIVPLEDIDKGRFSQIIGVRGDREQCTVVECVSAAGKYTPPMIIIKGQVILRRWFAEIPPELNNLLVGTSESGYLNDTLFFQWLQHWEYFSRNNLLLRLPLRWSEGYSGSQGNRVEHLLEVWIVKVHW
jgi:hypothetical protein